MQEPLHYLTVRELAERLSSGAITSVELTEMYLARAEELDPPPFELPSEPRNDHDGQLATMVTITRDVAPTFRSNRYPVGVTSICPSYVSSSSVGSSSNASACASTSP